MSCFQNLLSLRLPFKHLENVRNVKNLQTMCNLLFSLSYSALRARKRSDCNGKRPSYIQMWPVLTAFTEDFSFLWILQRPSESSSKVTVPAWEPHATRRPWSCTRREFNASSQTYPREQNRKRVKFYLKKFLWQVYLFKSWPTCMLRVGSFCLNR